ncbi:MAG: hypothetical protein L0Y39_10890 [Methylococcaceae bacterium]|nr:hypothetical protein [Methylococcaceae bacterium]
MLAVRRFARRLNALTGQKAAAKNHLHALMATQETPQAVLKDARLAISQLEQRIDSLLVSVLLLIAKYPKLQPILTLLTGIKGIAETSAVVFMGELLLLPPGLSHREWVKFAGLVLANHSTPAKASTRKRGCRKPVTALFVQP